MGAHWGCSSWPPAAADATQVWMPSQSDSHGVPVHVCTQPLHLPYLQLRSLLLGGCQLLTQTGRLAGLWGDLIRGNGRRARGVGGPGSLVGSLLRPWHESELISSDAHTGSCFRLQLQVCQPRTLGGGSSPPHTWDAASWLPTACGAIGCK